MVKKCSWCGMEFETACRQKKYCCPECARLAHLKLERDLYYEKTYLYNPEVVPSRCRRSGQTNCLKCSRKRCVYD